MFKSQQIYFVGFFFYFYLLKYKKNGKNVHNYLFFGANGPKN